MMKMKNMACEVIDDPAPRLDSIRWAPIRYRTILPLEVMKHYQCVVIGAAQGTLTVAMATPQDPLAIPSLRKLTGRAIFPVLVEPARMGLLLRRIERYERYKNTRDWFHYLPRRQISSIVTLSLSYQRKKRN